jgi:hypothetical protein
VKCGKSTSWISRNGKSCPGNILIKEGVDMSSANLGVTNTITGKEQVFYSWKAMARWIIEEEAKVGADVLLPFCNNWNLDYRQADENLDEYTARLIDMAIGLQLI